VTTRAETPAIDVVHAIPGRTRVRIDGLKRNPSVARRLAERLGALPGMRRVDVNPLTGTVLLVYDANDTRWLEELPEAAGVPGLDVASVRPQLDAPQQEPRNGGAPSTQVADFFGGLNQRVGNLTGGWDLGIIVPALLVLLGLRSLFAGDKVRAPTWYDLLWFGFGTFVMLNAGGEPGASMAAED
jgi:hypothetical protein